MKKMYVFLIALAMLFSTSGCVLTSWIGGDDENSIVMIAPFITQYEENKEDLAFLRNELTLLTMQMPEKDSALVEKSYNILEGLIDTAKSRQRNGNLTITEADVIWSMMKENYDTMIVVFDYYSPQMSPPLRVVYNSTKRTATGAAAEFDGLLKLAKGDSLDIKDLEGLLAKAGSSLLPALLSML